VLKNVAVLTVARAQLARDMERIHRIGHLYDLGLDHVFAAVHSAYEKVWIELEQAKEEMKTCNGKEEEEENKFECNNEIDRILNLGANIDFIKQFINNDFLEPSSAGSRSAADRVADLLPTRSRLAREIIRLKWILSKWMNCSQASGMQSVVPPPTHPPPSRPAYPLPLP